MFQRIMAFIISGVCLLGGLFMFLFGMSNIGTQYFSLGPTLLGLFLVVYNVFMLYSTFAQKNDQGAGYTSTSAAQSPVTPASAAGAVSASDTRDAKDAMITQAEDTSAVQRVLSTMNQEIVPTVFYGSEANAEAIVAELLPVLVPGSSLDDDSAVRTAIQFYVDVWIRKHGGFSPEFMTTSYIKSVLFDKYSYCGAEAVSTSVDRCVAFVYDHDPKIRQRDEFYEFQQNLVQSNASQNANVETLHLDDADYGLVPEKPVFVAGFPGTQAYLESLCLSDGTQPTFNRTGSMEVQGIEGMVDAYEVMAGGRVVTHIFICLYGNANSTHAPRGFVLR